jgi:antimicrobial peptide system SdpB family protein
MPPFCDGIRQVSIFCTAPRSELPLLRWVCVALLLIVASGWRPRLTGIVHWWICVSFQVSALLVDGGDQVAAVLTLLLLPITLTDGRRWHWSAPLRRPMSQGEAHRRLWAAAGHALLRLQVAGIYFHAAVGKLAVPEWKDGTVMFYWGTHEAFGAPAWFQPIWRPILVHGWTVAMLTWSVILLEMSLSIAALIEKRYQRVLMWAGIAMHLGIIVVHSLPSFGLIMVGALTLYLHPLTVELAWPSRLRDVAVRLGEQFVRRARVPSAASPQPAVWQERKVG